MFSKRFWVSFVIGSALAWGIVIGLLALLNYLIGRLF